VNVFLVPKLEVGYGVVADLSDEGVEDRYISFQHHLTLLYPV
jgi:hypothetical protein